MFWIKKKKQLSEITVDELGKIIEPGKPEEDFTIHDFIKLIQAGAMLLDKIIEYNKEEKGKNDSPKSL